ncbi:MAG: SHOCT domain-containing protein [Rhodospirillaceae bacterium]|nr:SHOCT domain-containing protein [Rhodospirillaceae bacterium]
MTTRPSGGITSAETDSESGSDGDTDVARDLFALKVMRDRGLISQADYDTRRAELLGPPAGDGGPG